LVNIKKTLFNRMVNNRLIEKENYLLTKKLITMKRTTIIAILCSLISSISTYLFLEGFKTEIKDSKNVVKELKGQVKAIEDKYKSEIQYWVKKNNYLQEQVQKTDFVLSQSKQKESSLKGKIHVLISESKTLTDTSAILSNCDSLKQTVNQFIVETNTRDSLCDNEILQLKNLVQNKDSAMADCENSFTILKAVTDSSLSYQNKLTEDLKLANKKIKRGNLRTKFLSTGTMILATVTTILLLHK
jgi:hypothetical protein